VLWPLIVATLAMAPLDRHRARAWTIDDGLPQSSVTAIGQDRLGWLHLGTFGGAVRFDGMRFDVPPAIEGVGWSSVRITAMLVDDDDTRWLGLQGGQLVRIDPSGTDTQIPDAPNLVGVPIWAIMRAPDGLWVAGSGGVARWADGWTPIDGAAPTRALLRHRDTTWLGGVAGLQRANAVSATTTAASTGTVHALAARGDELIVAGPLGVVSIEGETMRVLDRVPTDHLAVTASGSIYAASGDRVRIVGEPGEHIVGSSVRDLFVGREGALWIGTDGHGVVRLVREDWWLVEVGAGALPIVESAHEAGALHVGWGCEPGGLVRIGTDGQRVSEASGCVRSLAWHDGELIAGIANTVARVRGIETETLADLGHAVIVVRPIGDTIWIGTDTGGAFRLDGNRVTPVDVGDRRVLAIEQGASGDVWFGTQDGLSRLVDDTLSRWTRSDGVPAAEIRALAVDADGTVLLGSYGGGLGVLRDGVLHRLTSAHGLADNVVSAVLDDGTGALWLHGNRGLTRLPRTELEAWLADPRHMVSIRRWATPEGNGGGQPAGIVLDDGSLALPTIAGVVRIDPAQLHDPPPPPAITVLHAAIDGVPLVDGEVVDVPAGPGNVDIEFTSAIQRYPELATFEYRVVGDGASDTGGWVRGGKERRLRWAGFGPGEHRIELRVRNESSLTSPVTTLGFVLAAQWYDRWSIRIAIALGLLGTVIGAAMWRARVMRAHLAGLQREIDQRRVAEAESKVLSQRLEGAQRLEAVGRLAGGVAHEFNNLFAAIRGAAGSLPQGMAMTHVLEASVARGARLTAQLLSFAQRQHLDPQTLDLDERMAGIETMLRTSLRDGIALRIEPAGTGLYVRADGPALDLAIVNLVLGARDALPGGGTITVTTRVVDDATACTRWPELRDRPRVPEWIVVEVTNDGAALDAERLEHIFEPSLRTRTGGVTLELGLPALLGFATQSGGTLAITSREREGTHLSLVLPRVAAARPSPPAPPPGRTGPLRIVVVDDDELVLDTLAMLLRRAGHEAVAFADPRVALAALQGDLACDLLVSDVLMPGLTGSELATAVLAARPGLPMLFVSGFLRDVDAATLPGVVLPKPFGSAEVLAAVEAAMQRAAR
jgi:signal transduction histidine kinase/ligand-binding sensor domain-containing protein